MTAGSTYTPIMTTTIASATSSITLSSIPQIYTDLELVVNGISSGSNINYGIRFNGDSGSNYSSTRMYTDGSTAISDRLANTNNSISSNLTGTQSSAIHYFMNYSNTTLKKSFLIRSTSNVYLWLNSGLWRSTAAINSIEFVTTTGNTLQVGTTLTLYGITAA